MVLPILKATDRVRMLERQHSDPPMLWVAVTLGSITIHVFAFWVLRLLLMGGLLGGHSERVLIPVDVIPVASKTTSPTQSQETPRTSNRSLNRSTSASSASSTRANSQRKRTQPTSKSPRKQQGISTQKQAIKSSPEERQSRKKTPSTKPNSSSKKPNSSGKKPNSSGKKPNSSSKKPNSSGKKGPQSGGSKKPSPPKPAPPIRSSPEPSPNSQQGGGFSVTPGKLDTGNTRDILHFDRGDQLATPKQKNTQLSSNDLTKLGISLNQVVELKVVILIKKTGTATVYPTSIQLLRGNISSKTAEQLAKASVEPLRFNPTVMAGQPVDRDYSLTLTINPSKK